MDFSQNAVKMLTPNIKQPSISVPGLSVPKKLSFNHLPVVKNKPDVNPDNRKPTPDEIDVSKPHNYTPTPDVDTNLRNNALKNQILQRKAFYEPQPAVPATTMCNPLNLLVNGKVIRYVPGMPGPVAAEGPVDMAYGGIVPVGRATPKETTPALDKPEPIPDSPKPVRTNHFLVPEKIERLNRSPSKMDALEVKTDFPARVSEVRSPVKNESKSPCKIFGNEVDRQPQPNSLALKPTTASLKQHHGLTPTMFNQILISPDTPRVAKKYAEHFLHGNYFSYLGLEEFYGRCTVL
ncbi:hypothetical protein NQ317_016197 [Molorchus minor]|uniref:Uncharacterized protein n=1 Tax=Molorchus minor TaxID=1323400 RepID=A0ABQ9J0A0_9CUCU|nr:hypothetical protein NQ317_016197 [Molorchus minor]